MPCVDGRMGFIIIIIIIITKVKIIVTLQWLGWVQKFWSGMDFKN